MNATLAQVVVLSQLGAFGSAALVVLGAIIIIAVAFLVFQWGWEKLMFLDPDVQRSIREQNSYMGSYKGANFGEVSNAIKRSKGNNSADHWGM